MWIAAVAVAAVFVAKIAQQESSLADPLEVHVHCAAVVPFP